jgi:drug/metabolite transporter (DMT)-like permease
LTPRLQAELLLLAALWGASFLFMRIAAPEFGPVALVFVRVGLAAAVLLPLLAWRGDGAALRQHWRVIFGIGVLNSALPFVLFSIGALALTASLMSVFNATAPIWTALIAWWWLGDKLDRSRSAGLMLGIAGVVGLSWGKADFKPNQYGVSAAWGIAACVLAAVLYGVAANVARKRLQGVPPLAVAAGTQIGAAAALLLPAVWLWPTQMPGATAWGSAVLLALGCTALAYVLYFRLLALAGTANAVSVTFLVPVFAIAWGWLILGEVPTATMLAGCTVVLLGTALATGRLRLPGTAAAA